MIPATTDLLGQSMLIIGPPSSYQIFLADELAFQSGRTVVYLSDTGRLDRSVFDRLDAWSLAKKVDRSIVIHRIGGARAWQSAADGLEALRKAEIAGDLLLVRDLSGDQALQASDNWLTISSGLADAGGRVLTLANWGDTPKPDLTAYPADIVLEIDMLARMTARLVTVKPAGGLVREYRGREVQFTLVFEPVEVTADCSACEPPPPPPARRWPAL